MFSEINFVHLERVPTYLAVHITCMNSTANDVHILTVFMASCPPISTTHPLLKAVDTKKYSTGGLIDLSPETSAVARLQTKLLWIKLQVN